MSDGGVQKQERESRPHEWLATKTREAVQAGRLDELVTKTGLTRPTITAAAAGAPLRIPSIVALAMFFNEEETGDAR